MACAGGRPPAPSGTRGRARGPQGRGGGCSPEMLRDQIDRVRGGSPLSHSQAGRPSARRAPGTPSPMGQTPAAESRLSAERAVGLGVVLLLDLQGGTGLSVPSGSARGDKGPRRACPRRNARGATLSGAPGSQPPAARRNGCMPPAGTPGRRGEPPVGTNPRCRYPPPPAAGGGQGTGAAPTTTPLIFM